MMFAKTLAVTFVALACVAQPAATPHPYHVSMAEVEFNSTRKTFEVALCVWPEDLQKAVSKMENGAINIDTATEKDRNDLFRKYVAQKFRFVPSEKIEKGGEVTPASIRWVGSEITLKKCWLYFEVDGKSASGGWSIENEMFFELNDDQLNLVQVKAGKNLESRTLSASQPSLDWSLNGDRKPAHSDQSASANK
jgi:hypothetical protein